MFVVAALSVISIVLFWTVIITLCGFCIWLVINKKEKIHPAYIFGIGLLSQVILFSYLSTITLYSKVSFLQVQGAMVLSMLVGITILKDNSRVKKNWLFLKNNLKHTKFKTYLLTILIIIITITPLFIMHLPMSTDSQGFALQVVMIKNGGTTNSLAPFQPDIKYVYPPAFFVLSAYTSDLFGVGAHEAILILGHLFAIFIILHMFLIGYEIKNKSFGILMVCSTLITLGLLKSLLSGHLSRFLAFALFSVFIALYVRLMQNPSKRETVLAGLFLGGVALVNPTILSYAVMAILFFFVGLILFGRKMLSYTLFKNNFLYVPVIGILTMLPWFLSSLPLILHNEVSSNLDKILYDWGPTIKNIVYLTIHQGMIISVLALGGLYQAIKRWNMVNLFFLFWLIGVLDISMFGFTLKILNYFNFPNPLLPLGFAWISSIIPLAYFASVFVDEAKIFSKIKYYLNQKGSFFLCILIIMIIISGFNFTHINSVSKKIPPLLYGEFASPQDIEAYEWLKKNTAKNSLIFNYIQSDVPQEKLYLNYGNYESRWLTGIAEREGIIMPTQPSFINKEEYIQRLYAGQKVYLHPDSKEFRDFIIKYGVTHVLVPHFLVDREDYYQKALRWKKTKNPDEFNKEIYRQDFLHIVYDKGNVLIYEVDFS